MRSVFVAGLMAAPVMLVAACDEPKPRNTGQNGAPAANTSDRPVPAAPAWLAEYAGKTLTEAVPEQGNCVGNTDIVEMRHTGSTPGTVIIGWGWDLDAGKAVERVILVDRDFKIAGGGEGGQSRPDVPAARPEVTSSTTGWRAITSLTTGAVDAYGITNDGRGVCRLGHLDF